MVRCFLTGVEMQLEDAYVLNVSVARHALRDLHQQVTALERLVDQLAECDRTEGHDKKGKRFVRRDRRLVSESMAKALSAAYPQKELFVTWREWHAQQPFRVNKPAAARQKPAAVPKPSDNAVVSAGRSPAAS